jgi:protein gp37
MSSTTNIEWTDSTWNCLRGCSRVSEGCRHCYAEKVAYRFSGAGQPYEGLVRINAKGERKPEWNGQVRFIEAHLLDPLKWGSVDMNGADHVVEAKTYKNFGTRPRRIFVNSMSDLFHENVSDEWIDKIFAVMALCPQHTFQILTKRPRRMLNWATKAFTEKGGLRIGEMAASLFKGMGLKDRHLSMAEQAAVSNQFEWRELEHVWLGVSVEDQKTADERIPLLLQTPAAVRFISAEPLLGPIDAYQYLGAGRNPIGPAYGGSGLDWVIVGGESGPGARPMHPDWVRSLRDQCVAAKVAFFFKQWGEWLPAMSDGADLESGITINCADEPVRVGKKAAGALLDGREWREFPGQPS